ncbi:Lysine methyltransferasw [Fulvia fulva]|uniref:Lysine methyltransferasw n=1 Tax=Passalora fulva TaxID=5499 RepID=A0A9Q8L657_PASFU|nr:Lysine methyltransferasw [Fulvia fulva]KAK4635722.1 Lysine methyltransferasw [Fulvia fulva]KAK4637280.1 Lysine methyltransferasw [Fulvia fulva]UJO11585.1 Lysine methyltransferasw [Fulvia fulva]WPV08246.1 Lysine methyltransferasw [Fulvia fulva]WPV23829.1 Lysine methyltransferasw [Fulvia fulva]
MQVTVPWSECFEVTEITNAGRGVVATRNIAAGTLIHASGPPAFHVVFKPYAKETCAFCFAWDRGRTLPVRDNVTAKVFCTSECQARWVEEQGKLGVEAWLSLAAYARSKKNGADPDEVMSDGPQPGLDDIHTAWREAEKRAKILQKQRTATSQISKSDWKRARAVIQKMNEALDWTMLSYTLCGALYRHQHPLEWQKEVLALAMDERPYKTQHDLHVSCNSYVQLTSIMPLQLLPSLTPELCRTMLMADNHNAFGIRAGGEDSEEYMGYGVYPSSSYFNHSCSPNLSKKRVGRSWEFRAAEDIAAGEQCCITYLGGDEKDLDRQERQNRLMDVWGFECCCTRCVVEFNSTSIPI